MYILNTAIVEYWRIVMSAFMIAMAVVIFNGAPQYWYNINEVPYSSTFACEARVSEQEFQRQVLDAFQQRFNNQVATIRVACIPENKKEEYTIWMNQQNELNRPSEVSTSKLPPKTSR